MDTVLQAEAKIPANKRFEDLCLPKVDQQLDAIKASAKRGVLVAVFGVALTSLIVFSDLTSLLITAMEMLELKVLLVENDVTLFLALGLVFATMMGSFAFCLPRIQGQVTTYSEKFDTVVTIARQITLADGIGDNEKRKRASDILWQAKPLREKSRKRLVRAATGAILLGCLPWVFVLAMTNVMHYGPTVLVMAASIVCLKLMLVQRILGN